MMSNYQEDVARMRIERKQAEAADQYEQARQQYNEAVENRENASLQFMDDPATARADWNYWDGQVEEAERALAPYMRPPPPDRRAAQWDWQNAPYLNKVVARVGPQYAQQGIAHVDALACRHHPRFSPGYNKFVEDYLELYSENATGVAFDSKDQIPTWRDGAKASGLSEQEYTNSYRQLRAQGRIK
jgi:hypothetical protein